MSRRAAAGVGIWLGRLGALAALAVTLAILGFYASRLSMPLPIYASDEAAYLIRALYPDDVVARNPAVTMITNGVHLSVIRAAYETGGPYIIIDRIADALAYLGGMVVLWRIGTRGLARRDQAALLMLALGFAYWRFAASNLAEGLFVGVLALICWVTQRWWRARPMVHALAAGALMAALVLVKPHGLAVAAGLAAVAIADAAIGRDWRRVAIRIAIFAPAFFLVGNLIQRGAQEPVANPFTFFMSQFYASALGQMTVPNAATLALQALGGMVAACAVLAGTPLVAGGVEIVERWRLRGRDFRLAPRDVVFLLLAGSLAATLVMVAIFAFKVASSPGETQRLWGRYFEFYAPVLWLAAAPAIARPQGHRTALACGAVTLVGLGGLLSVLQGGVVLFPWDASVLTAFFESDPVRAPLNFPVPYRALAAGTTLLAAIAYALRGRATYVGLALVLVLSALSTWQDYVWVGAMVKYRNALERDVRRIWPALPPEPAAIALLTPDANVGHLGFLRLHARPTVVLSPSDWPMAVTGAEAVVMGGPDAPPGGPWREVYKGQELSLWRRAPTPPPLPETP
ncbi:MAG: hypothetical protein ACJ798_18655 [Phenylobacterium sp.]